MATAGNATFGDDPPLRYIDPAMTAAQRALIRVIEVVTGQKQLKAVYNRFRAEGGTPDIFWSDILRRTGIKVDFDPSALAGIPRTGLLVVANHPFGLVDGLILCWLISLVRSDFQLLINSVLIQAPETKPHFLPISFAGTRDAQATNLRSRADARRHLDRGGVVVVFPAGGVSTAPDRLGRHPAVDARWQPFVGQLIQRSRATVVPIWFGGQNSRLFQIASHVSQTLRLSLIFHEVKSRIGAMLPVVVGAPIPFEALAAFKDRQALADHLRDITYGLSTGDTPRRSERGPHRLIAKLKSLKPRRAA